MTKVDDRVAKSLDELSSTDVVTQRAAAKILFREARNEYTAARKSALGKSEVVDLLGTKLESDDPELVEQATGAVAMIFTRYYQDARLFPVLARLTKSARKLTRLYAATGIAHIDHPERWTIFLMLLTDRSPDVKQQVCRIIIDGSMAGAISETDKKLLKPALTALIEDPHEDVRILASNALRTL